MLRQRRYGLRKESVSYRGTHEHCRLLLPLDCHLLLARMSLAADWDVFYSGRLSGKQVGSESA